jgi:hypothetical protein
MNASLTLVLLEGDGFEVPSLDRTVEPAIQVLRERNVLDLGLRCFEGRIFDIQRGAWVACERCSGSGRVVDYLYSRLGRRPR